MPAVPAVVCTEPLFAAVFLPPRPFLAAASSPLPFSLLLSAFSPPLQASAFPLSDVGVPPLDVSVPLPDDAVLQHAGVVPLLAHGVASLPPPVVAVK